MGQDVSQFSLPDPSEKQKLPAMRTHKAGHTPIVKLDEDLMTTSATLKELENQEQKRVLDVITEMKKCGLDSVLDLPQIVVCGDQSSGKSSVLEALTEIPFPRADNLCTRYATEISLRNEPKESLVIKVIPDTERPQSEQDRIRKWSYNITNMKKLGEAMKSASSLMGLSTSPSARGDSRSSFSRDTLSVEITGPDRPQLDLVDIPGLIQSATNGISKSDVITVAEITKRYISQKRTICLAVIAATNDAANQPILELVRTFDPEGDRTIGVITKPDLLPKGSGAETAFIGLARNEDVYFKLGWHVIRNRKFEETTCTFADRNNNENIFFRTSNFKVLPRECLGIDNLRPRLADLLFQHIQASLPRLLKDMGSLLQEYRDELRVLGSPRSTDEECKLFLMSFAIQCRDTCKAGLTGQYGHSFFQTEEEETRRMKKKGTPVTRLRAIIQQLNDAFAKDLHKYGHAYVFKTKDEDEQDDEAGLNGAATAEFINDLRERYERERGRRAADKHVPQVLTQQESHKWAQQKIHWSRGEELMGNFNPQVIGNMFNDQSKPWEGMAISHVDDAFRIVESFLREVISHFAPKDVAARVWTVMIRDWLLERRTAAVEELHQIEEDRCAHPINYNHYYTARIQAARQERVIKDLMKNVPEHAPSHTNSVTGSHTYQKYNVHDVLERSFNKNPANSDAFTCNEALDCLKAIYTVQQKVFVANVTTQVVERQIVRGLEEVFSPVQVTSMDVSKIMAIASETNATASRRVFLQTQVKKLEKCHDMLMDIIRG